MFQSSSKRLRAWLSRFDDILGDPPADARPTFDSARDGAPYSRSEPEPHPHRQPLRWERKRRPGSVAAAPAICISPVRAGRDSGSRERSSSRHVAER